MIGTCAMWVRTESTSYIYHQRQQGGVQRDFVTFLVMLNAFAIWLVALDEGRPTHEQTIQCRWDLDVLVGNSLVGMSAKVGA
jgi:hypothetical protein